VGGGSVCAYVQNKMSLSHRRESKGVGAGGGGRGRRASPAEALNIRTGWCGGEPWKVGRLG
jgi:ribosome modulation factor